MEKSCNCELYLLECFFFSFRIFRNIHRHVLCRVTVATSAFVLFLLQLFYNCCTQTFAVYKDFLYLWHAFCMYCLLFGIHFDFVLLTLECERKGGGRGG